MVININPNRINVRTGTATTQRQEREADNAALYVAPKRSDVNHIPSNESLKTLISSAVAALRKGVRWDRGTILNLLV